MNPIGWVAVGFCLPFALAATLLATLAGMAAWERHHDDRHPPVPPVWVRLAHIRHDSPDDFEDFEAWEQELESGADA